MPLIPSLSNSLAGMKTAQGQLDIISRNITNVDTVGYTRKSAQQSNSVLAGYNQGVKLNDVTRQVNEGLLRSYLSSNSLTGNLASQNEYLSKTETLLGSPQANNSISANVASLQTAFNTFASDVTSASGRYNLLSEATTLTSRMNSISQEIQKLRGDADLNITEDVEEINSLLDSLKQLNDEIVKYKVLRYDGVADLEDNRDQALRDLSSKIDITYFKRDNGEIVIQTKGGVTLLDDEAHHLSHNATAQASPTMTYAGGNIAGIFVDGWDITSQIQDGSLKGLIEVRDTILPSLQSQLDELAGSLKDSINQLHNQGTAFPNTPDSLTGTRGFLDTSAQQIKIEEGDVRFVIFDDSGKQVATTNLRGGLGFTEGTLDDMATELQNWLQSATGANLPQASVSFDKDGKLVIKTGDSNYNLSIIDEEGSPAGSAQKGATIKFDVNGDGEYDRTFEGFSSFFGLNDFFVGSDNETIYDSKVLGLNSNLGVRANTVWSFSDKENGLDFGSITITSNDSLSSIVSMINNNKDLNGTLHASLVPNGSGYMLRIENTGGGQLEISETGGNGNSTLIERIGLAPSNVNAAISLDVRSDIKTSPVSIVGGTPEFNATTGEYVQNPAANSIATKMSEVFSVSQNFKQSGTIAQTQTTLSNYASTFVGNIASQTSTSEESLNYQQTLTDSIATKEAKISGVDIDEELGQMIIFQQTYAACAQAFTASKEILDMLLSLV